MIQARGLTKRYGPALAVDGLTFDVPPGRVTGFLGPNGAGKSTTMRLILGLDQPTVGTVTVDARSYRGLRRPLWQVGAMLESRAIHPGRSARGHLLALAHASGIPRRRVDEVLSLTGLDKVAGKRAGGFSLGMSQRLGMAAALLGDAGVLLPRQRARPDAGHPAGRHRPWLRAGIHPAGPGSDTARSPGLRFVYQAGVLMSRAARLCRAERRSAVARGATAAGEPGPGAGPGPSMCGAARRSPGPPGHSRGRGSPTAPPSPAPRR
jgi:ABC-type transport system involved in cytochrome c biogenesis ATPase subunit